VTFGESGTVNQKEGTTEKGTAIPTRIAKGELIADAGGVKGNIRSFFIKKLGGCRPHGGRGGHK